MNKQNKHAIVIASVSEAIPGNGLLHYVRNDGLFFFRHMFYCLFLSCMVMCLVACGQKGPLYLPAPPVSSS